MIPDMPVWAEARRGVTEARARRVTARAVGETMVVTLASGAAPRNFQLGQDSLFGYILSPFEAGQAMTGSYIFTPGILAAKNRLRVQWICITS